MLRKIKTFCTSWCKDEGAVAAVEAAYIFPLLLTLLLGVFDMGQAVLANQKTIRASQVVGDLVTRARSLSPSDLDQAVSAGELSFIPLNSTTYGVDITSIRFVEDDEVEVVWRETRNMQGLDDLGTRVSPLAEEGNGVVIVAVEYDFRPTFSGFIIDEIPMREVAFTRGRRSAVVCLDGAPGC